MSRGALFGNNATRSGNKNLVEIKAGKMTRKGKMVYPDNRKGLLYVYQSEDALTHFCWKDRTSGVTEDDLIIFPDDCEFKHVPQCKTGRVYLLRFKSTNRIFFFWLQDLKTDKDEEYCKKINEVLNSPPALGSSRMNPEGDLQNLLNNLNQHQLMQLFGAGSGMRSLDTLLGINRSHSNIRNSSSTNSSSPSVTISSSRPSVTQTPVSTTTATTQDSGNKNSSSSKPATTTISLNNPSLPAAIGSNSEYRNIELSELQNFLSGIEVPSGTEAATVQRGVASELTSAIPAAITTNDTLELTLANYLPPKDNLCTTLSSPQFSQALSMFWSALQSGQAGPMVRQFGLGADAVNAAATGNIEQFVTALETETKAQDCSTKEDTSATNTNTSATTQAEKKDDDDEEGMALD